MHIMTLMQRSRLWVALNLQRCYRTELLPQGTMRVVNTAIFVGDTKSTEALVSHLS